MHPETCPTSTRRPVLKPHLPFQGFVTLHPTSSAKIHVCSYRQLRPQKVTVPKVKGYQAGCPPGRRGTSPALPAPAPGGRRCSPSPHLHLLSSARAWPWVEPRP